MFYSGVDENEGGWRPGLYFMSPILSVRLRFI